MCNGGASCKEKLDLTGQRSRKFAVLTPAQNVGTGSRGGAANILIFRQAGEIVGRKAIGRKPAAVPAHALSGCSQFENAVRNCKNGKYAYAHRPASHAGAVDINSPGKLKRKEGPWEVGARAGEPVRPRRTAHRRRDRN